MNDGQRSAAAERAMRAVHRWQELTTVHRESLPALLRLLRTHDPDPPLGSAAADVLEAFFDVRGL